MSFSSLPSDGSANMERLKSHEEADFLREELTARARRFGSAPALVQGSDGTRISYQKLPEVLSRRIATWSEFGSPGSLMGGLSGTVFLRRVDNSWEALLDMLAAAWAGATVLPISGRWPEPRLQAFLAEFDGSCTQKLLPRGQIWHLKLKTHPLPETGSSVLPETGSSVLPGPGSLLATSGSTGEPKLAHHTWRAHWANASGAATVLPLGPGDAWGVDLPLWHASGWGAVLRCLHAGAAAVLLSDSDEMSRNAPAITHISMVATQLKRALESSRSRFRPIENCRGILVGGGPVPGILRERALSEGWPLHVTYGMTETASQICTTARLRTPWPEVCGPALPGREVRRDADGTLLVRGDVLATGYWHPHRGLEIPWHESGWLGTGDMGEWIDGDQGGWLITGRQDRRFICAGENLHPERIEAVLLGLPGIRRAVVVPREDVEYGHRPAAFIEGLGSVSAWQEQAREQLTGLELPVVWLLWPEGAGLGEKPSLQFFRQVLARATAGGYALPEHV